MKKIILSLIICLSCTVSAFAGNTEYSYQNRMPFYGNYNQYGGKIIQMYGGQPFVYGNKHPMGMYGNKQPVYGNMYGFMPPMYGNKPPKGYGMMPPKGMYGNMLPMYGNKPPKGYGMMPPRGMYGNKPPKRQGNKPPMMYGQMSPRY